jgi:hypothetical protein
MVRNQIEHSPPGSSTAKEFRRSQSMEDIMRSRLARTALATAALAVTLGVAGCATGATSGSASVAPQELRNDAAQSLADARQATLVPVGTQLELLDRAALRARLAGDSDAAAEVSGQIAAYTSLATAIEAAPTADSVRTLVDQAQLDLDGDPVAG